MVILELCNLIPNYVRVIVVKRLPVINCCSDASGAWQAGLQQQVVVIVDVIDMSTTLEAALEAGALKVYGAGPDSARGPVPVNPLAIGRKAGLEAKKMGASVIIVAEPRWGSDEDRLNSCGKLLKGLHSAGIKNYQIVPNLGITTAKLVDFQYAVVIAVTNSGGVAFDAGWTAGGTVLTATVARTWKMKGTQPARIGVDRALTLAMNLGKDISFVAASSNSQEDILAAQYLAQLAMQRRGTC
jgi:hypothetical protein